MATRKSKSEVDATEVKMGLDKESSTDTNADQKKEERIKPVDIDMHQYIAVINGFNGMLDYWSKRTGEIIHWDSFGEEQYVELIDLQMAKGTARKFFENNWFQFKEEDEWVIDFIGVRQYYKNSITKEEFDQIVARPADEVEQIISKLPKGQKDIYAVYARERIEDGTIDSRKVIAALERALEVQFNER